MHDDTIYFSSLREPFAQLKSQLNYFNVLNISGVPLSSDRFTEYLTNLEKYETVYKSTKAAPTRYCIPDGFSMSRNVMSFILGFPNGFNERTRDMADDREFVQLWISKLKTELDFVVLTEYFYESLVLLRRTMCWKLKDVLFSTQNTLPYKYRHQRDPKLVHIYKDWSKVDYVLYDTFNRSMWNTFLQQESEFWDEVKYLRKVNNEVNEFCESKNKTNDFMIAETHWNEMIVIKSSFCRLLKDDLLSELQKRYDAQLPIIVEGEPPRTC